MKTRLREKKKKEGNFLDTFRVDLRKLKEACKTDEPCPNCGATLYFDLNTLNSGSYWCESCDYEKRLG